MLPKEVLEEQDVTKEILEEQDVTEEILEEQKPAYQPICEVGSVCEADIGGWEATSNNRNVNPTQSERPGSIL